MFDFTKNITLDPAWQKKYLLARGFLYLLFLAGALYFADIVLFPSQFFSFDFKNPNSQNNTIFNVETSENKINFDAFSAEKFSFAHIRLYFENNLPGKDFGALKIRKTYKAFSYPEGESIILPDDIPLESNSLAAATGEKLRFADGSLISFNNMVFAVAGGQAIPFSDPETFVSLGYNWNNVIFVNKGSAGIPRSNILFTANQPHPDGTIFAARENGNYYLIKDGKKQQLANTAVLKNYFSQAPISVNEESLTFQKSLILKNTMLEFAKSYQCSVPISEFDRFPGNNYQFEISGLPDGKPVRLEVEFSRKISWLNLRDSLSKIKSGILNNFGYATKQ